MIRVALLIVAWLAVSAQAPRHEEYHPEWLRKSGCCGPEDMRRVTVRWVPSVGWAIVAIGNPPGYPVIRLLKPLRFDMNRKRKSQDGYWWAGLRVRNGVAFAVWFSDMPKPCIFGHGSGQ